MTNQQVLDFGERGFHYGDGLFETIAVRQRQPRLWGFHTDRLRCGSRRLGIDLPSNAALLEQVETALAESSQDHEFCVAKLIVTAGSSQRGYGRSLATPAAVYVGVYPSAPLQRSAYEEGVTTLLCQTRLAVGSTLAGLKTLNRLEQVLARSEYEPTEAFEGLTLDADGRLICGTMSNVFLSKDNSLRTPSLDRCGVAGTMRRHVIERLAESGVEVEITDLNETDLTAADEVFISNSQFGVVPVQSCGEARWQVGEQTKAVMALLAEHGIDECRL